MRKSIGTILSLLGVPVNKERTSYPEEPKAPVEDMGSMLIHPLPKLPPMYIMPSFSSPIFIPRKGKFKGYMRENRKCTFNKNK